MMQVERETDRESEMAAAPELAVGRAPRHRRAEGKPRGDEDKTEGARGGDRGGRRAEKRMAGGAGQSWRGERIMQSGP